MLKTTNISNFNIERRYTDEFSVQDFLSQASKEENENDVLNGDA